jgi:hypothetical protein
MEILKAPRYASKRILTNDKRGIHSNGTFCWNEDPEGPVNSAVLADRGEVPTQSSDTTKVRLASCPSRPEALSSCNWYLN